MLTYPLQPSLQPGETRKVAPGVHWLRMPLSTGLNHINLWILEDAAGWTLVDTGMHTPICVATWERVLAGPMASKPVHRVICTHMHPDHVGMAGWLTERFSCPLWMTRMEYLTARLHLADAGRSLPVDIRRFYASMGWDDAALRHYESRFGAFGQVTHRLPESYRRIEDGEDLVIGGRVWRAVIGRGHSPEHLCLHCPELQLLISGDQVLPRISSNVSVHPVEPDADPLSEWLETLASIKPRVPADVLVLPAHNDPFRGLHVRIDALIASHMKQLDKLRAALLQPMSTVETLGILFGRELTGDHLIMGTGEALAHLNWLMHRGEIERHVDASGVARFQIVSPGADSG
jgi:glyoxylase-like metal-dependent hydrolase (beta-lactamase superfamily II)